MKFDVSQLAVYFIMGSNNCGGEDPLEILSEALAGGITCFQFREKGMYAKIGKEKEELARKMQEMCQSYQVPFIVNDDIDLAIKLNADGVHVGQDDQTVEEIKKLRSDLIIGVSATSVEEAVQAVEDGATYIGVGPVFATATKSDAKTPIGLYGIRSVRAAVPSIPMVAIGGIDLSKIRSIRQAGADGVSVISAISLARKPRVMVESMRREYR